ncbi:hypothetical protein H6F43_01715, partial [Leptolyngbya sp. FACHB-36]|uniref:transporter associated domain-containing protein n=1 Tax=Leptolyngbya sp. FACHB-36 TaxID=2692808 RepID=UPI00198C575C
AKRSLTLEGAIDEWIRPVRFVSEYMLLSELLPLMQRSRQPMVMVMDEYGGTAGLVTIQDLIAEILGDAVEPVSSDEQNVQILDDQTFLVQAQMNLEEVNDLLNLEFPLTDDYQTLGGFVISQLQKIPQPGETLRYDTCQLTVISIEGPRLNQIQIRRLDLPDDTKLIADDRDRALDADDRASNSSDSQDL